MSKIVMVNTVATGSTGSLMMGLRDEAVRMGHRVLCAYGRGSAPDGESLRIGTQAGVLAHVAKTRFFDLHARGSKRATQRFVKALEAWEPDLLHLHNIHGYYLHAETLFDYIRQARLPVIWTLHDCWALTGHCSHFMRATCTLYKTGCYDCPLRREYPASRLLDRSAANYAWKRQAFSGIDGLTLALPSRWLEAVVAESFLKDARRVVIPNGVDLSLFRPSRDAEVREAHGVRAGQLMLLSVAAPFDERKGFSDALKVAQILGERVRLVMVGLSEKQLRGLPGDVTGVRRTGDAAALARLYGAADCLLNPTREDTYPTVNMEAMASGTPVAAYADGGCIEQLSPPCGITVPVGDVAALADAALALAAQKEALAPLCRETAEERFNRLSAFVAYAKEYQGSLGG